MTKERKKILINIIREECYEDALKHNGKERLKRTVQDHFHKNTASQILDLLCKEKEHKNDNSI